MNAVNQKAIVGKSVYIAQGEYAVAGLPGAKISTILGSCVATCLWDPVSKIGGMNHFLLPDGPTMNGERSSFGANAMELLINALIKHGADRSQLRAKVFGGAEMYRGLTRAGSENGLFVLEYLKCEDIPCDGQSLGGNKARRVEFEAYIGRARQRLVSDEVQEKLPVVESTSSIELF